MDYKEQELLRVELAEIIEKVKILKERANEIRDTLKQSSKQTNVK